MLEGLDEINWSQLHHAYGEASDVPILIHQLLSSDKVVVDKAIYELFGNIWHQGTIYEASSYAVPFLYKLLKLSETPNKLMVAFLLASLATGKCHLHDELNEKDAMQWQKVYEKHGTTLEAEIVEQRKHEQNVRRAIEKDFSLLYPYLFCEESEIRNETAKAFGEYPQFKSETLPLLEKALASENDEYTKESIENSIKILSKGE